MIENVDKLDIYNNSAVIMYKKTPKRIISWITILIIFLILFILLSFVPFNIYKTYVGYVSLENNDSFITCELGYSDFPVTKNKKTYIKGIKYNYEIINIEQNIIKLKINLEDDLKIQNNIVTLNVLKDRTTIFNILVKRIKKGFGL